MNTTIIILFLIIVAGLVCITLIQQRKIKTLQDKLDEPRDIFVPLDIRIKMIEDYFTIRRLEATVNRLTKKKKQTK